VLHFCFISFYHEFSFEGGSEEELTVGYDEITTKGKKSNKKVRSVSRRTKLKKTKNFRLMEELDEDKQDYSGRSSEDRESVPQYSSEEGNADESTEALRENVHEEESESKEEQDESDMEVSPGEAQKSHTEPSSPDDVSIAEISDDAPLVNN
jgi:sister-chromatid-cohesion protein PDS5